MFYRLLTVHDVDVAVLCKWCSNHLLPNLVSLCVVDKIVEVRCHHYVVLI